MAQKFHYGHMSTHELKVMLQGVYTTMSENYGPKNPVRYPSLAARWWSYSAYNNYLYDGACFMVCFPLSNYTSNFTKVFRRHRAEKRESYHCRDLWLHSGLRHEEPGAAPAVL